MKYIKQALVELDKINREKKQQEIYEIIKYAWAELNYLKRDNGAFWVGFFVGLGLIAFLYLVLNITDFIIGR